MHQPDSESGSVVGVCDADSALTACMELIGKIHDARMQAQLTVVHHTVEILQADADRKNRWRRWVPFLRLEQAPSHIEVHNELASDPESVFADIQARYADAEKQALDTAIIAKVQDEVGITMGVLRAMSALDVKPPIMTRKLNRIGF